MINKTCKYCKCNITLKNAVKRTEGKYRNECKPCRKEDLKKKREMNVQEKDLPKYPVINETVILKSNSEVPTPQDFKEGYKEIKGWLSKFWSWTVNKLRRKNGISINDSISN